MPQFTFSLSNVGQMREAGIVQSESFTDALDTIDQNCALTEGDTLEIGVSGFPPARFERVRSSEGIMDWQLHGRLAA
ncbi:MAG TPA: hypothetical protein VKZ41_06805 [Gemmatimonadales bacterium]|nr:hypothetical protein [Gemmatimonadales bacterium]